MSQSPTKSAIDHVMEWAQRPEWAEIYSEMADEHIAAVLEEFKIPSLNELAEKIGIELFGTVVFANAFEDFLREPNEAGETIVDEYLRRRSFKENAIGRAYLTALNHATLGLYEVLESVPGSHMLVKDKLRGGEVLRIEERSGTQYLHRWDVVGIRIIELNGRTVASGVIIPYEPDTADTLEEILTADADLLLEELKAAAVEDGEQSLLLDDLMSELRADATLLERLRDMAQREAKAAGDDAPGDAEELLSSWMAMTVILADSAPLFSEYWLRQTLMRLGHPPRIVNSDDEELELVEVTWPMAGPRQEIERRIDDRPDICRCASDEPQWDWYRVDETATADDPERVSLGTIKFAEEKLVLRCNSGARAERGKALVGDLLGGLLGEPSESRQTLEAIRRQAAERREEPITEDASDPGVVETMRMEEECLDRHYRTWPDHPLPALDGATPRQAVETEGGRAKVTALLKYMENGESRRTRGKADIPYNFGWMWRDLGLARPDQ